MIRTAIKIFFRSLPLLAGIIVLVEFVVTNQLAGMGNTVETLDRHILQLTEEHERLSQEVASVFSLRSLSERANELGFTEPTEFLTIRPNELPVALNPRP